MIGCIGFVSGHQVDSGFYKHWYSKWPTDRNRFILGDPLGLNRETPISNLFEGSEVPIQIDIAHDIRAQIFDKLLINCSVNTIGAISRLDCGEIVSNHIYQVKVKRNTFSDLNGSPNAEPNRIEKLTYKLLSH